MILAGMPGGSIHTYAYKEADSTPQIIEGAICESPMSHDIVTSKKDSTSSEYTVISRDCSYGVYIQKLQGKSLNKKLIMKINPPEAAQNGCSTSPSVGTHEYKKDTTVQLKATAVSPWNFEKWTGRVSGTSPQTTIKMDEDKEAIANFVKPVLTLSQGPKNPICPEASVKAGSKNVRAINIVISVNEVDDWKLQSLKFKASGDGNEKEDISKVYLYLGDETGNLLGTSTFSEDNGSVSFDINLIINKASSISLMLTYDLIEEKNCPCKSYEASITVNDIVAEPLNYNNYQKLPEPPSGVSGIVEITYPYIEIDESTNSQYASKNHKLEKPLKVKVNELHKSCLNYFQVRYLTGKNYVPKDASGYMFENGSKEIVVNISEDKTAETEFIVGNRAGKYLVSASLETKPDFPYKCQCYCTVSQPIPPLLIRLERLIMRSFPII